MESKKRHLNCFEGQVLPVNSKLMYQGFCSIKQISLQHSLFDQTLSPVITREVVLSSRVVGVLLCDPIQNTILMIEQFRPGVYESGGSPWIMEIVAGRVDAEESWETSAYREALEETACVIHHLMPIVEYYPSPGVCDEKVKLYCGLFDSTGSDQRICGVKAEQEDIRTCLMTTDQAFSALKAGEINNGASLIALQWLYINYDQVQAFQHLIPQNV